MINKQARIPDLQARERHAKNAQLACQQLTEFTAALDELITPLEASENSLPYATIQPNCNTFAR
jgi:hypothetical protein